MVAPKTHNNIALTPHLTLGSADSLDHWLEAENGVKRLLADVRMTMTCVVGYWPSYNVPFYPVIFNLTGSAYFYPSYYLASRGKIMRRDHSKLVDIKTTQQFARYHGNLTFCWQSTGSSIIADAEYLNRAPDKNDRPSAWFKYSMSWPHLNVAQTSSSFLKRAYKCGFSEELLTVEQLLHSSATCLFNKMHQSSESTHCIHNLLPSVKALEYSLRNSQAYSLPQCKYQLFKMSYVNWCLFSNV